ncbi:MULTISPECIES: putative Ig domain-containing protein [unclassified Marinobacterium]|uniref:beta strand repeat-containing protein n=1 Tax=unclassified Marinobacterium TaxID=2644139 RepID=UPI001568ADBA|nr:MULTISPECIES: putative Ig domain-containing protein [unclassified Marinobacterium]NRP56745.1 Cadherin domain protein [Marinobacterium sp. xm-d-510]NRP96466.1 Cadherin domain protein [Marinobacterium sp. xm-a-127]
MLNEKLLQQIEKANPELADAIESIRQLLKDGATTEQLLSAIKEVLGTQPVVDDITVIQLEQIAEVIEKKRDEEDDFVSQLASAEEASRWDLATADAHAASSEQMGSATATDAVPAAADAAADTGTGSGAAAAGSGISAGVIAAGAGILALAGAGGSSSAGAGGSSSSSVTTSGVTVTESIDDTGANNEITLTFTFDEDVTGFDASDVTITGGVANGAVTPVNGSASVYTLVITGDDPGTPVTYSIAQGAATTLAEGTATAAVSATVDQTGPTYLSTETSVNDQTVTLTFSEDMSSSVAVGDVQFTIDNTIVPASSVSVDGAKITFTFAPMTFTQGDQIDIDYVGSSVDALQDASGNDYSGNINVTSITLADGYIKGASVYLELDDGSRVDTGIVTDANGNFFLTPETQELIASFTGNFSIVAVGGFNVDTGLPNTQDMRAPQGSTVINPLTTLIDEVVKSTGDDVATAQQKVKTALGITSTQDLTAYDPISASKDSSDPAAAADALAVQKAAAAIATVIAYAEKASGNESASESVVDAMVSSIAANATIDLTDASTLQTLTGQSSVANLDAAIDGINSATDVDAVSTQQGTLLDTTAPSTPIISLVGGNSDGLVNSTTVDIKVAFDTLSSDGTAVSLGNIVRIYESADLSSAVASHTVTDADLNRGYVTFSGISLASSETIWAADITDKSGNESDISETLIITQDTEAPTVAIESPISNGFINAAEDDVALIITGTATGAEEGQIVTVELSDGVVTRSKTAVVAAEAFSVKVSSYDLNLLDEGEITVTATVSDIAGNEGSNSVTYVYDASAPAAPGLALDSDTGADSTDGISSSIAITEISGVEATATAEYSINGAAWTESYTAPTTDGDYTISARQTDAAGNVSEIETITVTLDATNPKVAKTVFNVDEDTTAVATLAADEENVVWTLGTGGDNALFTLSEAGVLAFAESPDFETDATSYTVNVVATDTAGNTTEQAIAITLVDVNEAPTVETIPAQTAVTDQSFSLDLADYFADEDAADATLSYALDGSLPAGLALVDGVISGTATATAANAEFTATATDSAGNTVSQTFTLQSVEAPAIVSFTMVDETGDTTTGNQGSALTVVATLSEPFTLTLNSATPSITLNFGGTTTEATYASHDGTAKTITFTATAPAGDATSTTISAITLGAATLIGDLSGQALITDAYGAENTTYALDNTVAAPVANLATDSGESAEDDLTNDATVNVTLADDVASWEYTTDGGTNWNAGTGTSFELADDTTYAAGDLGVRQTDLAGNTSTVNSNDTAVVTDMTAPAFSTSAALSMDENTTAAGDVTADADAVAYALSGTDATAFSISEAGALSLNNAADFETKASYTLTVTATDAAGNSQTQDVTVTVNDVNDAPTAEGTVATQTAVVDGDAFSLDLSSAFADQDDNITGYTLTAGTLPSGLSLNATTGVISGTATASTSAAESESVTITATDAGGETATQTFLLQARTVDELDENAPVFISGDKGATLFDIFAPDAVLYKAEALDETTLSYSISGDDAQFFNIDSLTGDITLKTSAFTPTGDYSDEYDFANDGYTLTLTATDLAGNTATKNVDVDVTPVELVEGNTYLQDSVMTAEVTASAASGFTVSFGIDDSEVSESIQSLQVDVVYQTDAVESISLTDLSGLGLFAGTAVDNGDGTSSISYGAYSLAGFDITTGYAFTASVTLADGHTSAFVGVSAPEITYETTGEVFDEFGFTEVLYDVSSTAGVAVGTANSEGFGISGEATVTGGAGADVFHIDSPDGLMLTITDFTSGEDVLDVGGILFEDLGWLEGGLENYESYTMTGQFGNGVVMLEDEITADNFLLTVEENGYGFELVNDEYVSSNSALNQKAGVFMLDANTALFFADTNPNSDGTYVRSIQIELGSNSDSITAADLAFSTPYLVSGTSGNDVIDLMSYVDADVLDDTWFDAGQGGVVATGNGGADTFAIVEPDGSIYSITDFNTGEDTIDVTRLLTAETGYEGFSTDATSAENNVIRFVDSSLNLITLSDELQTLLNVNDWSEVDVTSEEYAAVLAEYADLDEIDNAMGLVYSADYGGAMLSVDTDSAVGAVDMEYIFFRIDQIANSDIVVNEAFVV